MGRYCGSSLVQCFQSRHRRAGAAMTRARRQRGPRWRCVSRFRISRISRRGECRWTRSDFLFFFLWDGLFLWDLYQIWHYRFAFVLNAWTGIRLLPLFILFIGKTPKALRTFRRENISLCCESSFTGCCFWEGCFVIAAIIVKRRRKPFSWRHHGKRSDLTASAFYKLHHGSIWVGLN